MANAAAPANQVSYLQSFQASFEDKYTRFVNWTSKSTIDIGARFATLNPEDSALRKTARVFFGLLSAIVLSPFALAVKTLTAAKDFVCDKIDACRAKKPEVKQDEVEQKQE